MTNPHPFDNGDGSWSAAGYVTSWTPEQWNAIKHAHKRFMGLQLIRTSDDPHDDPPRHPKLTNPTLWVMVIGWGGIGIVVTLVSIVIAMIGA